MKIKLLDPSVSNKIAAGEVVERPASIVKELSENSIDASATGITVEIRGGGCELIRISDNGCGMEEDDVKNAFLRHATSKISKAEDLNDIFTLGFRGEALASVASVAKVKLTTRTANALEGTEIALDGGVIKHFISCGCPEGTSIWVEDLFFNTPARRKFLKRPSQETSYVSDTVNSIALSHPEISVKYISDGRTVLRTPGDGRLDSCIRAVFGSETAKNIIPISKSANGIKIEGFLGNREIQKSNRTGQTLFINGRCVKNDIISSAVQQGYAGRLNIGKFPFFVLNITMQGNLVDVNVHPTKKEVRFADGLPIFETVAQAVEETLLKNQEIPTLFKQETKNESYTSVKSAETISFEKVEKTEQVNVRLVGEETDKEQEEIYTEQSKADIKPNICEVMEFARFLGKTDSVADRVSVFSVKEKKKNEPTVQTKEKEPIQQERSAVIPTPAQKEKEQKTQAYIGNIEKIAEQPKLNIEESEKLPEYKTVGVIFDTYIIIQCGDDVYIIDQHAAHERLRFEALYEQTGERSSSQILLLPRIIKVSPSEQAVLEDMMPKLEDLGYEIENIGFGSFAVKATPSALGDGDPESFITSLLDESGSIRMLKTNELKREKLMQLACKSAVKAGDKLTDSDVKKLLALIVKEQIPLSCPHGRPILIRLTSRELEVRFKRIQ